MTPLPPLMRTSYLDAPLGISSLTWSALCCFSVPSRVWSLGNSSLFVGGYKSAVNRQFLKSEGVALIVNAAPGVEKMFPAHKARLVCDLYSVAFLPAATAKQVN